MTTWNYHLPLACFLIYGREFNGQLITEGSTKSEVRATLKRRFNMKRVPVGTEFEIVATTHGASNAKSRPKTPGPRRRWLRPGIPTFRNWDRATHGAFKDSPIS